MQTPLVYLGLCLLRLSPLSLSVSPSDPSRVGEVRMGSYLTLRGVIRCCRVSEFAGLPWSPGVSLMLSSAESLLVTRPDACQPGTSACALPIDDGPFFGGCWQHTTMYHHAKQPTRFSGMSSCALHPMLRDAFLVGYLYCHQPSCFVAGQRRKARGWAAQYHPSLFSPSQISPWTN